MAHSLKSNTHSTNRLPTNRAPTEFIRHPTQTGDRLLHSATVVVADEAHELKNPKTQRCMAMSRLGTMRRIALTGYPLQVGVGVGGHNQCV